MAPSAPSNAAPSVLGKGDVSEISAHHVTWPFVASRPSGRTLVFWQVTETPRIWKCSR